MSLIQVDALKEKYDAVMHGSANDSASASAADDADDHNAIVDIVSTSPSSTPTQPISNDVTPSKKRGRSAKSSSLASAPPAASSPVASLASPLIDTDAANAHARRLHNGAGRVGRVGRADRAKRKLVSPRRNVPLSTIDDVEDNESLESLNLLSRSELQAELEGVEVLHADATDTVFFVGDLYLAMQQYLLGQYNIDGDVDENPFLVGACILPEHLHDAVDDPLQFASAVSSHALASTLGRRPNSAALARHRQQLLRVESGSSVYAMTRAPNSRSMTPAVGDLTDRAVGKVMTQVLRNTKVPTTAARLAAEIAPFFFPAKLVDVLIRVHAQREQIFAHNASLHKASSST